jgi:hypothetical protein
MNTKTASKCQQLHVNQFRTRNLISKDIQEIQLSHLEFHFNLFYFKIASKYGIIHYTTYKIQLFKYYYFNLNGRQGGREKENF